MDGKTKIFPTFAVSTLFKLEIGYAAIFLVDAPVEFILPLAAFCAIINQLADLAYSQERTVKGQLMRLINWAIPLAGAYGVMVALIGGASFTNADGRFDGEKALLLVKLTTIFYVVVVAIRVICALLDYFCVKRAENKAQHGHHKVGESESQNEN